MLSRDELETIREQVEGVSDEPFDAHETIHALLWHIDALEAQGGPKPLPKGARTLPDGSIRLGPPRRYQDNRKAAQEAYDSVGEARRRKAMQEAIEKRKGA